MPKFIVTVFVQTGMTQPDVEANATASGFANVQPWKAEADKGKFPCPDYSMDKNVEADNQELAWEAVKPTAANIGHCTVTSFRVVEVSEVNNPD